MTSSHSIIIGDCLEEMKKFSEKSIDIIVTSPPYNIGKSYNSYSDKLPRNQYLSWMRDIGVEFSRVLKDDGSVFLNVGSTNIDPWLAFDVASTFRETFHLQNNITWVKSISIRENTFGHFKPISSKRFLNQNHESIFHFTLSGDIPVDRLAVGVPFTDKSNIARRGHAQDKRCGGNTWFIPYETVQSKKEKFNHPAGYPVELAAKCILLTGKKKAVVLDPFMGTGTTVIAAYRLGHKGIGIDIDKLYADTAKKRIAAEEFWNDEPNNAQCNALAELSAISEEFNF